MGASVNLDYDREVGVGLLLLSALLFFVIGLTSDQLLFLTVLLSAIGCGLILKDVEGYRKLLALGVILLFFSAAFVPMWYLRNNEAREYEREIMERKGLSLRAAREWIQRRQPQVYDNPYLQIAFATGFLALVLFTVYALVRRRKMRNDAL